MLKLKPPVYEKLFVEEQPIATAKEIRKETNEEIYNELYEKIKYCTDKKYKVIVNNIKHNKEYTIAYRYIHKAQIDKSKICNLKCFMCKTIKRVVKDMNENDIYPLAKLEIQTPVFKVGPCCLPCIYCCYLRDDDCCCCCYENYKVKHTDIYFRWIDTD